MLHVDALLDTTGFLILDGQRRSKQWDEEPKTNH